VIKVHRGDYTARLWVPTGAVYYFTNEAESTLDVVDTKTLRVTGIFR